MSSPDWSRIPFEKMPEWKKQEMLSKAKATVSQMEEVKFKCEVCGKVCKNQLGLNAHLRSHNK